MKIQHLSIVLFLSLSYFTSNGQGISCQDLYEIVTEEGYNYGSTSCYGSTAIAKAEYYTLEGTGFVIAYLKSNSYDYSGKPYIFCGVSSQRWSAFKSSGSSGSWGEAYNEYIREMSCNCN